MLDSSQAADGGYVMAIGLNSDNNKSGKSRGSSNEPETTRRNRFIDGEKPIPKKEDEDTEQDERDGTSTGTKKAMIIGACAVIGIIIAFIVVPKIFNNKDKIPVEEPVAVVSESPTPLESATPNPDDGFRVGDTNYKDSKKNTTTARYFDANDFVKDLEGNDVKAVYSYKDRTYIKDHVAYTAKRGIIDDGMEIYWIDVVYKKKKYRVQVPFYYFKDFDDTGICRVEIELLTLDNGSQIISYMQVISED